MKISIITPSRKRPKYLLESFESFISKAKNNKDIQYIGVIDDDDMETKEYKDDILKMGKKYDVNIELYETPRIPFEQYLNTGATVATGDILFFIADDVFCDKNGWDTLMSEACEKYLDEQFFEYIRQLVGVNFIYLRCSFLIKYDQKKYDSLIDKK